MPEFRDEKVERMDIKVERAFGRFLGTEDMEPFVGRNRGAGNKQAIDPVRVL